MYCLTDRYFLLIFSNNLLDIRSQTEQNTRVVGDFTKSVSVVPIVKEMIRLLTDNERTEDWKREFDDVMDDTSDKILDSLEKLDPSKWRRQYLQTRFFETGKMSHHFQAIIHLFVSLLKQEPFSLVPNR